MARFVAAAAAKLQWRNISILLIRLSDCSNLYSTRRLVRLAQSLGKLEEQTEME